MHGSFDLRALSTDKELEDNRLLKDSGKDGGVILKGRLPFPFV